MGAVLGLNSVGSPAKISGQFHRPNRQNLTKADLQVSNLKPTKAAKAAKAVNKEV